jgi:ribosomal RNA-processing protein 8
VFGLQAPSPFSTLQQKMQEKLKEGHFRFLNEKLYSSTSEEAFRFFQENPQLFFEVCSVFFF